MNYDGKISPIKKSIKDNSISKSKLLLPKLEDKLNKSKSNNTKESLNSKRIKNEILKNESKLMDDSRNFDTDTITKNEDLLLTEIKNKPKKKETSTNNIAHLNQNLKRPSIRAPKRGTYTSKPHLSNMEKLNEVENIRNKVTEDYAKITAKNYYKGKKSIISRWKTTLEYLQNLDAKLFLYALKCLGDIYVEFDEFETAKNFYFYFKFFANYMELLEEVMISYESLGNVYKFLFQYHKAIKCYKKQIEIAWILNNKISELRAYDNIGIQYFYLGNRDKAKYYHERMLYGRSENQKSDTRESVCKYYKNKNFHMFNDEKYIRNIRNNDELKDKLRESLALFEENKSVDLESVDILKNHDNMKNSFISEVDMTFSVIPEKYLSDDHTFLPVMSKINMMINNTNGFKASKTKEKYQIGISRRSNNVVDNMILSHLSTKRKEFNTDRFRKIFESFDKILNESKETFRYS